MTHENRPLWRVFLPVALLTLAGQAKARPASSQVNMREACRQAVAGAYLDVYAERERLLTYIKATDSQVKALGASLKEARKVLADAVSKANSEAFDMTLAANRDEAQIAVNTQEAELKDYESQRAKAASEIPGRQAEEKRLRALIEKVFAFERAEDQADGGYPVHLAYRSGCPKYRVLCPLPPKEAEQLLAITVQGEPPEVCKHYASLSKIP